MNLVLIFHIWSKQNVLCGLDTSTSLCNISLFSGCRNIDYLTRPKKSSWATNYRKVTKLQVLLHAWRRTWTSGIVCITEDKPFSMLNNLIQLKREDDKIARPTPRLMLTWPSSLIFLVIANVSTKLKKLKVKPTKLITRSCKDLGNRQNEESVLRSDLIILKQSWQY